MCNCRLKYPRGMSIVVCVVLYVAMIGLLVSFFQPYWITVPDNKEYSCVNNVTNSIESYNTTAAGACGLSGMCHPKAHENNIDTPCFTNMTQERCIWYDNLEVMGTVYDQVCTLLFLAGVVLVVFAWFLTLSGCCTLTCCCCNIYNFIGFILTLAVLCIVVSVLLWLGMLGSQTQRLTYGCPQIYCQDLSMFSLGDCNIGWSAYLGFASWICLVIGMIFSWISGCYFRRFIKEDDLAPRNTVNPYEKQRVGKKDSAFYFRENVSSSGRSELVTSGSLGRNNSMGRNSSMGRRGQGLAY